MLSSANISCHAKISCRGLSASIDAAPSGTNGREQAPFFHISLWKSIWGRSEAQQTPAIVRPRFGGNRGTERKLRGVPSISRRVGPLGEFVRGEPSRFCLEAPEKLTLEPR